MTASSDQPEIEQNGASFAIAARRLTRRFAGTFALDGVDFSVAPGEVHGLVGKNGAGKSTLLKILAGALAPDAGEIRVSGRVLRARSPADARAAGIAVVYQNLELHLELSVAANIYLGAEPRTGLGLIDDRAMLDEAAALVERLGLELPVGGRVADLDIADRQQVAIVKAVRQDVRVLLLDEPTSALNKSQTDFLFRLIGDLAHRGIGVVFISHHLDEVLMISDRVSVLRDGRLVDVLDARQTGKDALIGRIVGTAIESPAPRAAKTEDAPTLFALKSVRLPGRDEDIAFELRRGEILGLTGLTGAGARELVAILAGVARGSGDMALNGAPYAPRSVRDAIAHGVVFVPEDMRGRGLVMQLPVASNLTLSRLGAVSSAGWLWLTAERSAATRLISQLNISPPSPDREVGVLSGGNQRKTLIGRAMFAAAQILVLEEPTQGVDVAARSQIHARLRQLAEAGAGIIFASTDLDELIVLADRIIVLRDGAIGDHFIPAEVTEDQLLAAIQHQGTTDIPPSRGAAPDA